MPEKIILPEIITDLEQLNPGCNIDNIIGTKNINKTDFEFLRSAKDDLEFRTIPSLNDKYEINENGTILRNVSTHRNLKIFLDTHHSSAGYYASFINFNGIVRRIMIHKIVAECWLGPKPDNMEIDHIDRNSHNNHYTNLRYVTHSEQMKNRILSQSIIQRATLNCRKYVVERVMKPVKLVTPTNEIVSFESMTACALYLSKQTGHNPEHIRKRILGKRKSEFMDFKILYVNEKVVQVA